jgi:hypothetical protein
MIGDSSALNPLITALSSVTVQRVRSVSLDHMMQWNRSSRP